MFIIKGNKTYLSRAESIPDKTRIVTEVNWVEDRDMAKRFETKKEAQDFKEEFYITGSIIPA